MSITVTFGNFNASEYVTHTAPNGDGRIQRGRLFINWRKHLDADVLFSLTLKIHFCIATVLEQSIVFRKTR